MVASSVKDISAPAIRETFVDTLPGKWLFYSMLSKSTALQAEPIP
jgi:hypothetical protein